MTGQNTTVASQKSNTPLHLLCLSLAVMLSNSPATGAADEARDRDDPPILLNTQGSFLVGGNAVTNPGTFDPITLARDGQTIHGDHAYMQFQIPEHARRYPLVMWHGGGQFSKTWETTPDGRDAFVVRPVVPKPGVFDDYPDHGRRSGASTASCP